MVCKKCGKKLRENEKFCTICGYYNDDKNSNMTEEIVFGNNDPNNNLLDDDNDDYNSVNEFKGFTLTNSARSSSGGDFEFKNDRYIEAYVGEDYKWVMRRPFNLYAFLFSWLYFIYRKLYIIGIIGLVITGVIIRLIPKALVIYVPAVMLLSGFIFNPIYVYVVKRKVEKIKSKNDGTDEFELEKICKEKGGINLKISLLIYLVFLIIMFFTYFTISYNKNHNPNFWKENSENKANCISLIKQATKYFDENKVTGEIEEAECLVNVKPELSFDLYYKLSEDGNIKYVLFKQHDKIIEFVNSTNNLQELELKSINNTIAPEEKQKLEEKKLIESDYTKIKNNSKNEDKLIKEKKNYSQKLNYIFTKQEVTR